MPVESPREFRKLGFWPENWFGWFAWFGSGLDTFAPRWCSQLSLCWSLVLIQLKSRCGGRSTLAGFQRRDYGHAEGSQQPEKTVSVQVVAGVYSVSFGRGREDEIALCQDGAVTSVEGLEAADKWQELMGPLDSTTVAIMSGQFLVLVPVADVQVVAAEPQYPLMGAEREGEGSWRRLGGIVL